MKQRFVSLVILFFIVSGFCQQSGQGVGEGAAPFLTIPVGARAAALGGAFSASASDLTAAYWNPAGLGQLTRFQFGTSISSLGGALGKQLGTHSFLGVAYPHPLGTFALSIISHGISDIEIWSSEPYEEEADGTFDFSQKAVIFSFAKPLLENTFYVGANWKIVQLNLWDESAAGLDGIDLGLLYRLNERLSVSAVIKKHISIRWQDGNSGHTDYVPKMGTAGLAYRFGKEAGTLLLDLHQEEDFPLNLRMGCEYTFHPQTIGGGTFAITDLSLRGGLRHVYLGQLENGLHHFSVNPDGLGPTFGLGLTGEFSDITLRLDWSYGTRHLMTVNRFSLSCEF